MDAFYASVEQLDNPDLRGRPVIVGGTSDRGVVSAASYEARKYAIHSAMPLMTARKLCPDGVFLPVRMSRYKEISRCIQTIFKHYTPLVEPISLDEAFLDVTGSLALFGDAVTIARTIKEKVFETTQLTVSAGVATSKLIAKIASDYRKPDGLTVVEAGREKEFLAPLPIKSLWGVGKSARGILSLMGIKTIGDLSRLPEELLQAKFGMNGARLYLAARGIDAREVEPEREVKSIGHEETFYRDITDITALKKELLALSVAVGRRLRSHGLLTRTVTVKVKNYDFRQVTRSFTLKGNTDDTRILYQTGLDLLEKTEAGRKPVRLIGITAGNLSAEKISQQMELFNPGQANRELKNVNPALDHITNRFGKNAILPATLLDTNKTREDKQEK